MLREALNLETEVHVDVELFDHAHHLVLAQHQPETLYILNS